MVCVCFVLLGKRYETNDTGHCFRVTLIGNLLSFVVALGLSEVSLLFLCSKIMMMFFGVHWCFCWSMLVPW